MENRSWIIDGKETMTTSGANIVWEDHRFFQLSFGGDTFYGEILEEKTESNFLKIKLNHRVFEVKKQGPLDELISSLGMDVPKVKKLKELQAPMPGQIVSVALEVGQEVNVDDAILTLEAMKMENVLKAEGVGIVKSINVKSGDVVEKGSVLIEFE